MKENVKLSKDEENTLVNPLLHTSLMHVISPFERAAADHGFQPFQYRMAQTSVYISNKILHQVRDMFFTKLRLFYLQQHKETQSVDIPLALREAFHDPAELLPLPENLQQTLQKAGCTTLYTIMVKGRRYFEKELNLNAKAIKAIEDLFAKHNCANLFHVHYHPGY